MLYAAQDTTSELLRRIGYVDLAGQVTDRSCQVATRVGDPNLPLMVTRRKALLISDLGAGRAALAHLRQALAQVEDHQPGAAEARGSLHLRAAVIAAREQDAAMAWRRYGEAVEISRAAGAPLDAYGTNFVSGNVLIHSAAVAVELGDMDEALRRDAAVGPPVLAAISPERRAHHDLDMARAQVEAGRRVLALNRLLRAEREAPQMTRYHRGAHETARTLESLYRTTPEALRRLLSRMRIR